MAAANMKKLMNENPVPKDKYITIAERPAKIAERAYYKAEQRGFEAGHELSDWLEAEEEVARIQR